MDIAAAIRSGTETLQRAGVEHARADCELLLAALLQCDRSRLFAHPEQLLSALQAEEYLCRVKARSERVPLQYLLGWQEFWGRRFEVDPDVLIPRPETELIVEAVLAQVAGDAAIADIGTGSGCLAVTLAAELPQSRLFASDVSPRALAVAARNAARHGVDNRIDFLQGSWLEPFRGTAWKLDWIVSNPPYGEFLSGPAVDPEVLYEPRQAVFAAGPALASYEPLAAAAQWLKPGGRIAVELGFGLAERVRDLFSAGGWIVEGIVPDLAGIPRCLVARRK